MKIWVRKPALTLIGAAAIALAWGGWSGSQEAHTAGLGSPAAIVGAAALAPATALRAPGPRDSQFAKCGGADCVATSRPAAFVDCIQCLSEADGALFEAESVSAGEPWSTIVVGGLAGALPDVYDGANSMSLAGMEPGATAAPASEISTAAMVALGVVLLTARRAGRNRWASWKAPWRVSTVPASG
jgi:hypothetical protein